jgi:glycosyltransferase involved in cell wall biosynthesis
VTLVCGAAGSTVGPDTAGGIRIVALRGYVWPHIAAPMLLRANRSNRVVIDDLGHVIPWSGPHLTSVPGTAFFRHMHARTLWGQVGPFPGRILRGVESLYPVIYGDWPFVVESASSARDLERIGVSPPQIVRIPPGVDARLFHPTTLRPRPTMVYFAGLRPYKRPELAVRLLAELRQRGTDADLVIMGSGATVLQLRGLARLLGVEDHCSFLGRIPDKHLAAVVAGSWVNVHCSVSEGWGYSILEASAAGVPTVAFRVPGVEEAVCDGSNGVLAANGDLNALTDACERVLKDRARWTDECVSFAARYPWEATVDRWESHLLRLQDLHP